RTRDSQPAAQKTLVGRERIPPGHRDDQSADDEGEDDRSERNREPTRNPPYCCHWLSLPDQAAAVKKEGGRIRCARLRSNRTYAGISAGGGSVPALISALRSSSAVWMSADTVRLSSEYPAPSLAMLNVNAPPENFPLTTFWMAVYVATSTFLRALAMTDGSASFWSASTPTLYTPACPAACSTPSPHPPATWNRMSDFDEIWLAATFLHLAGSVKSLE